jgi:6-phosphogluconolactonase
MKVDVVPQDQLATRAADIVATTLRAAVAERGRATVAFSGGTTAGTLLAAVAGTDMPWHAVDVLQVDERVAPEGDPDRNLTALREQLLDHVPLPEDQLHAMPVEDPDLADAAGRYADVLRRVAGSPPHLDLVHLGLGTDGHTASLLPGSPLLDLDGDLAGTTPPYQGRRRMTLTLPALSYARNLLWFVTGASKAPVVARLVDGDRSIPAGHVERANARLLLDPDAATALARPAISENP